jgi:hypothetical protein
MICEVKYVYTVEKWQKRLLVTYIIIQVGGGGGGG